jgi:glycosyltransferase involved in cell wall biosynthesis
MRIAFIMPTVGWGGGTRVVATYARLLARMGHAVCIVSPPARVSTKMQKFKALFNGSERNLPSHHSGSHLNDSGVDHRVLNRWRAVVDDDVPDGDVVVATWWETAEWVAALSSPKGKKVYFIQHHEIHENLPVDRIRETYRLPLHKIVVAKWIKTVMTERYGDHDVDVVPNSVDRTLFFAEERGKQPVPTVGFVYSTTPFKQTKYAIGAVAILRKRFPNMRIISFGTHAPRDDLPLPEDTEFFHLPEQNEIRHLYSCCDVWISASRSEGFNLPALEAMACRTPVVSTRTGWPEESIRSGWNGVLVNTDDVMGLASATESLLSLSEDEWRVLSKNACETASLGSWRESARLFEQALRHACDKSG